MRAIRLVFYVMVIGYLCGCSDDPVDNNSPGLFSANVSDVSHSSANVHWTESIDPDGDAVTYTVFLEGQEEASGLTALTHSFSGLEPETIYNGYVEARDGKGGTSQADFFISTEPEVIIETIQVDYREYIINTDHYFIAYFEVTEQFPSSYELVVESYSPETIPATTGRIYTWETGDSLPIGDIIGAVEGVVSEFSSGVYHANTHKSSAHISNTTAIQNIRATYEAIAGEAEVTITKL